MSCILSRMHCEITELWGKLGMLRWGRWTWLVWRNRILSGVWQSYTVTFLAASRTFQCDDQYANPGYHAWEAGPQLSQMSWIIPLERATCHRSLDMGSCLMPIYNFSEWWGSMVWGTIQVQQMVWEVRFDWARRNSGHSERRLMLHRQIKLYPWTRKKKTYSSQSNRWSQTINRLKQVRSGEYLLYQYMWIKEEWSKSVWHINTDRQEH